MDCSSSVENSLRHLARASSNFDSLNNRLDNKTPLEREDDVSSILCSKG